MPRMIQKRDRKFTNHAFVRYWERVRGLDVDDFMEDVCGDVLNAARENGATAVVRDGFTYIVEGDQILTVLSPGHGLKRRDRRNVINLDDLSKQGQ